jgi:long-chain fatty acid transport protein
MLQADYPGWQHVRLVQPLRLGNIRILQQAKSGAIRTLRILLARRPPMGKLLPQVQHPCSAMRFISIFKPETRCNLARVLVALVWGASALKISANGFGVPDQDAFATARGEAFVATADNASAISYNPAGITQLEGNNLRTGIYGINYNPSYQPPNAAPNHGKTYDGTDNWAAIPQFFYTYTTKDSPFSFGLGVYAPYGGNMKWPQDTGFNTVAVSGSLKYITINPVVAVKLSPTLSIGGGAMINYAKISMNQGLFPHPTRFTNFFNFSGDGWSVGYNAGMLWQPLKQLSFGATFRSSATLNFQGNTDFQLQPQPYFTPEQRNAAAKFTFPLTTVLGVSYRPTSKWNLEFDANYTGWDSFDTVNIEQSPPPVSRPFHQNIPVNLGWQASWMYEFGVTRYFENGWQVSGGYVFNENSVPDKYYTPLAADMDRNFFSIGAGHKGKTFDFDLAYQFGYGPTHTVTGSTPSSTPGQFAGQSADGRYSFNSQAVIVSVGMHF